MNSGVTSGAVWITIIAEDQPAEEDTLADIVITIPAAGGVTTRREVFILPAMVKISWFPGAFLFWSHLYIVVFSHSESTFPVFVTCVPVNFFWVFQYNKFILKTFISLKAMSKIMRSGEVVAFCLVGKNDIACVDNSRNVAKNREENVDSQMISAALLQEDSNWLKLEITCFNTLRAKKTHREQNGTDELWNVGASQGHF